MALKDEYLSNIRRKLSAFLVEISLNGSVNRLNLHITAEDVFCGLLNRLYGYQLVNANRERQNQSGVDLIDGENRCAVQITSENTRQKVVHTLEKFCEGIAPERLCDRFEQLTVLILTERPRFRGWNTIKTDMTRLQILTVRDLSDDLEGCELEELAQISAYLDEQLSSLFDRPAAEKPAHLLPTELPACEHFVEGSRDKELARLIPAVQRGEPVFIWGLGGMGKTQVAIQIAKRMASARGAYFLRYTLPVDGAGEAMRWTILQADFAGYRYEGSDPEEDFRSRLEILRQEYAGALLIIDNFDWPGKNLDDLRAEKSFRALTQTGVRLVLTTRYLVGNEDWHIGPISEEHLLRLMRTSYKDQDVSDDALLALIRAVDGHTLMVDLMAKTLARSRGGLTTDALLTKLKQNELDQKNLPTVTSDQNQSFVQDRIYGHLRTLFDLSGMDEDCRAVLRYATLLPEDGMNYGLFKDCLVYPKEKKGFLRWIRALLGLREKKADLAASLQRLVDGGWLQYANKLLTIHPVIREVCREELTPTDENCGDFLLKLWNRFDLQMEYNAALFQQIACCFSAASDALADEYGAFALIAGNFWGAVGQAQTALLYELRTVERLERNSPANPLALATAYSNVGSTYGDLGNHEKALEYQLKALTIREKVLPPDHPFLATSYNNVGFTYGNLGDYEKALEYKLKALSIREKALPPDHPSLAISYGNVGTTYGDLGDHEKALEYQLKALSIREKALPPEHPSLATSYNNVGGAYGELGDHQKALEYKLKDLAICEKVLPPDHPDLAVSYNNVGFTYGDLGDHEKALEYKLKALAIWEKALPPEHPALVTSYNNVGFSYFCMEDCEMALTYLEKALAIQEKRLPAGHPDTEMTKQNIAIVKERLAAQKAPDSD